MSGEINSGVTEKYVNSLVGKVASVHNLKEWRYVLHKFENIAQNYFGLLIPVVLSGRMDGNHIILKLVLKLPPTDPRFRESGAVTVMFIREIYAYTVIMNTYQKLQECFTENLKYIIPKCYYSQNEFGKEVLVLQDMTGEGYEPFVHDMFLDVDHIVISLKALAKLHALSFILSHKDPELYNDISKTCIPLTETSNKRFMDIMRNRLEKAITKFQDTQYIPLLSNLRHNCADLFEAAIGSVGVTCICHGDIWKENILYKYEDGKLVSACLIDYQTTRISSPAFDALYLIVSSTTTKLRQKYYTQLLDIYYNTFDKTLVEAHMQAYSVYPRPMFDKDLAVVAPACFVTANTAIWISRGLQEEGHVRSKQVLTTLEEKNMAINKYKGTVKGIIDDLVSYGYITL